MQHTNKNRILVMMATKSIIITKMLKLIFLDPKQPPVIRSQEWPIFEWKCEMPEGPTEKADKEDTPRTQYISRKWFRYDVPSELDHNQYLYCQTGQQQPRLSADSNIRIPEKKGKLQNKFHRHMYMLCKTYIV